ncbi:glycosyltransferase family 2 protein [Olsenella profusa]|uniref:Glycosyltransferase family 2 protein n=1 Tax=Olsenella profusa TaxID=138595 RepID=A0ABS2F1G5_9ACTN|nr:glycosyltransferase family 2 protein [Olsenella profusa]MBM6774819.1 glycosyltransferase family 2 protein [Olsenella profusa]
MRVLAIIPAYNEEESLSSTIDEFLAAQTGCDYLVVNDGSSDGTEQVCREHGYNHVTHPTNLGLTAGVQTGMKYALAHGYDAALQFDADGQHVPSYIPTMVAEMEHSGADIVIGSRFVDKPKPLSMRMLGSRLIEAIIRLTTGQTVRDPTSGLRLYNRAMMEQFARRFDFGPEPDSVAYLMRHGAKVREVQAEMRERQAGESYLNFARSISYMARTCTSILFVQWFR